MKTLAPALLLLAFAALPPAASVAFSAPAAFEGKVSARVTSNGRTFDLSYSLRPGVIRTDVRVDNHDITTITDLAKQETYVVMAAQHMYMVVPLNQAIAAAQKATDTTDASFEKTGATKSILGHACSQYLVKAKDGGMTEIWATEGIGVFPGIGAGNPMRPAAPKPWEKELMARGFFPLLVIGRDPSGAETFRLETISIKRETLPDADFTVPADYRRFDMPAMMGGLLNRGGE